MSKKLFSLILAAVLMLGMIPSVFAAGTTPRTIKIYNEEDGHTYEAYQVFKGDLQVEYNKFDLTGFTPNANTYSDGTTTYTVDGSNLKDADGNVVAVRWTPAGGTADWYAVDELGNKIGTKTLTNPEWGTNLDPTTKVPAGTGKTFAEALAEAFASEFTANSVTLDADSTAADVLRALGFITDGPKLADVINKYLKDNPVATTNLQQGDEGSKYYELKDTQADIDNNAPKITDGYYFIKDKDESLKDIEIYEKYTTEELAQFDQRDDGYYESTADDALKVADLDGNKLPLNQIGTIHRTESYTDFILKVVEDVNVKAKSDTPTVDKKILETRKVYDGSYIPVTVKDLGWDKLETTDDNYNANPDAPIYYVTRYYPTQANAEADPPINEITDVANVNENTYVVIDYTAFTAAATHDTGLRNTPAVYGDKGNKYALRVSENTASIGEYVQYEITGTIPNMEGYTKYYYMMTDTLSKGLTPVIDGAGTSSATFKNTGATAATMPVTVEIYDAKGTLKETIKETITYNADKTSTGKHYYSNITVNADGSHSMDIIFDNFLQYKGYAGCTVVVKYWALVNNKAIIGNPGNPNEVDLTYSRNPNVQGRPDTEEPNNPKKDPAAVTGTTPKSIVRTYITELELLKYDADTEAPLTGAKFKISGTRYIPVITTSEMFAATAAGGTYYHLKDDTYTEVPPTIDWYEYDSESGEVTVVHEGTYKSYYDWDGATVYSYENVPALPSYTKTFADQAAAQAALEDDIKPGYKKVTTVDIAYRTQLVDVEVEVDSEGRLLLGGLGAGDYIIEEIVAPAGYNLLGKKIELEIRFTTNNNGTNEPTSDYFTARWRYDEVDSNWEDLGAMTDPITVSYDEAEQTIDDNYFQLWVPNKKGAQLPETGGIGTMLFYVFGGMFVVAAGVLMIVRRRLSALR